MKSPNAWTLSEFPKGKVLHLEKLRAPIENSR